MNKIRLAILGATGMAGREALLHHSFLSNKGLQYAELTCVTASEKSVGKKLGEVFSEKENRLKDRYSFWNSKSCPEELKEMIIEKNDAKLIASKADYVISALGSEVAKTIEPELRDLGVHVFSNASSYRWDNTIPLMIPEVNFNDLEKVKNQKTPGKQICNPNCTTAGFVPLIKVFEKNNHKIKEITLLTQQALSGKGDTISSTEYFAKINGNVVDDWTDINGNNDEEWKSSHEAMKILSKINTKEEVILERENILRGKASKIIPIYSQNSRVAVQDGHLLCLFIEFSDKINMENLKKELETFIIPEVVALLPTTPKKLFYLIKEMPSSKDLYTEDGMSMVIGDIQQYSPTKISLWVLSHNLRRGATWAGRQCLELFLNIIKN